jgi:alpha-L-rhamnosidase
MNPYRILKCSVFLLSLLYLVVPANAQLDASDLRCEYKVSPLNISSVTPRLYWKVNGKGVGRRQSAYRVVAASDIGRLNKDEGDLWDSGKTDSSETLHITYKGKTLASEQRVYWKVKTWDENGKESRWSQIATWTMGLLRPADWKAEWVSKPTTLPAAPTATLDGANWIWHTTDGAQPPAGTRWFRATFPFPADAALNEAKLAITADDSYTVTINNGMAHNGDSWQNFQTYDVRRDLRAGPNVVMIEVKNGSAGPAGVIARLEVRSQAGERILLTDAKWESAVTKNGPYAPVRVLGPYGMAPWGQGKTERVWDRTTPYFRKAFRLERPVKRALLHATALGAFEVTLNGKRVGSDYLAPGWTDFRKRVRYLSYDVTGQMQSGQNAIGAILGDGWYASYLAFTGINHWYSGEPKLRLQLSVDYADGGHEIIGTDKTWKVGVGEVQNADLLMGCATDSQRDIPGWNLATFDDSGWKSAIVQPDPNIIVEPQINEPIRITATLTSKKRTEPKAGVHIYDFGQNMVGWVRLKVNGKAGQTITLRHAEFLNPDGTLYTTNLRSAKAVDTFVLRGGLQTLEPKFTFHGFQYVEITGLETPVSPHDVTGCVVSSDLASTLTFDSDNPLLNRLIKNIDWGFRGNSLDVPTDCPQRDERAGWTGDAQVFSKTAMLHRFAAPFFAKWMFDLTDGQLPDGGYPDVAPSILSGGNAAWEDSGVVVTYRLYEMYGDTEAIRTHWSSLTRFMEHLDKVAPEGIRSAGSYGDWLLLDGPQQSPIHGTAYYYYSASLMAKMADAIGETADAARYRAVAEKVREAFRAKFVGENGVVSDGGKESQTFYALAIAWDLIPDKDRPAATKRLTDLIARRGDHLATGFIGTPVLLQALARGGRADLANKLALTETYPSWLYQVKIGATTMWERWDGWLPEKGFQDPGMNSFNHYWLGCVGEWLYTDLAGIDTDGPGWSKVTIRPHIINGPRRVKCSYDSLRGKIACSWKRQDNGKLDVEVTIPTNVSATVTLPTPDATKITVGGKPLTSITGVSSVRSADGATIFTLGSGTYRFLAEIAE